MKIRHYLLLILTLSAIAFLQPLVLLLGGVTLLAGVTAFIYSDLPPERQDAWEAKLSDWLGQLRGTLRNRSRRPTTLPAGSKARAMTTARPARPARLVERPLPPTDDDLPLDDDLEQKATARTIKKDRQSTSPPPVEPWR